MVEGDDTMGGRAEAWHDGGYDTTVVYTQRTLRREGEGGWEDGRVLERLDWTGLGREAFGWVVG
jgi:hypothetical protein